MKRNFADYLDKLLGNRFVALIGKEVAQTLHNRQLLVQLLLPPTFFLILFGFALNPTFQNLKVGITDYSHSRDSREFIELLSQTDAFVISRYYTDQQAMESDLAKGSLTVGMTIPPEFARDRARKRPTQVQAVFDAVDANTASVASGYLSQLVSDYNVRQLNDNLHQKGAGSVAPTHSTQQNTQSNLTTNSSANQQSSPDSINTTNQQTSSSSNTSSASANSSSQGNQSSSATNSSQVNAVGTTNSSQQSTQSNSTTNNSDNQQPFTSSIINGDQQSSSASNANSAFTNASQSSSLSSVPDTSTNSGNSSNQPATQGNQSSSSATNSPQITAVQGADPSLQQNQVQLQTSIFYNPGLESSWFIVPGTMGILMTILGSQSASSAVVREKEAGTIEQLMMTPASNTQILLAKIFPLLVMLTFDAMIAIVIGIVVFNMPFRGSFLFFISLSILYFFVGISIGIIVATFTKSEQQAQLVTFFINPPLVLLSGASSPIAAMPPFLQWLTYLNPMRYYIEVCRGVLLKGVGLGALWHQVLILALFAIVLLTLSVRQFRRQLS